MANALLLQHGGIHSAPTLMVELSCSCMRSRLPRSLKSPPRLVQPPPKSCHLLMMMEASQSSTFPESFRAEFQTTPMRTILRFTRLLYRHARLLEPPQY